MRKYDKTNVNMFSNIRDCNTRTMTATKKGDLKGYCTVYYQPNSNVNTLSLSNLNNKYR